MTFISKRFLAVTASLLVTASAAAPAFASNCNQWDYFRENGRVDGMDLQAMAAAAERNPQDTRACYGTDLLTVEMTTTPVDLMGYSGSLKLKSQDFGGNGTTTYTLGSKTFKTRVFGSRTEIQTNDGRWKNIDDIKRVSAPLENMQSFAELEVRTQEMKEESDEHLAPIAENMTIMMVGGLMSVLAVPYLSNYAPLAENTGVTESVGGYSTDIWKITPQRASAYAASRGASFDFTGSSIRYWVSPGGLIIKIDAKFGAGITEGHPMQFTYKAARSAAPDPSWPGE